MRFDDRAANRKAHPGAAGFRREERVEDALRIVRTDPGSGISTDTSTLSGWRRSPISRSAPARDPDRSHGFDGIHD
jgi:hypothetical protein